MTTRWGWDRWSVRARLTVAAVAAVSALLAVAGVVLVWRVHAAALGDLDSSAQRRALTIAAAAGSAPPTITRSVAQSDVVQVVDARGTVVASSGDIAGEPRLFTFAPAPAGREPRLATRKAEALNGARYRVAAVTTAGSPGYVVYVGLPLAQAQSTAARLAAAFAAVAPALLAALAGLIWLLAGRGLAPVERLRRQAADISGADLQRRVDVPRAGDEVAALATTLNDLLSRIDESVQRQRRFVADAAHELRSPLATLRAQLEAALLSGQPVPVELLTGETARLSALVDDLLALARLDTRPQLRRVEVDLDDLVLAEATLLRARTDLTVDTSNVGPARLHADPVMISRLVRNLLDNAARHAAAGIMLSVSTTAQDEALLCVVDDGPGVPREQRERVFERFTRLDDARDRDAGGAGLGLAIVREVAAIHGGDARIEDSAGGAHFCVRLPVGRPARVRTSAGP